MSFVSRGLKVLRNRGPKAFIGTAIRFIIAPVGKLANRMVGETVATQTLLVKLEDAAEVDWTQRPEQLLSPPVVDGPAEIAWIMSPPGKESGGHQNLLRFIDFAEKAGHHCHIYLYTTSDIPIDLPALHAMLEKSDAYPRLRAPIEIYDRTRGVKAGTQAIFASGWETAYPAYLDKSHARRFYFVQDFEPSFYPLGSEAVLAENTYRFGFHGITAGGWLSTTLRDKYGMTTDHFDFAVDKARYHVTNFEPRNEVFFYARPVTPRRAFEFGVLALTDFAKLRPDVTINLAGWNVDRWDVPFAHKNLASLQLSELNDVYNRCGAGLVMSLSNMSLLPLELLSSGVTPVVNDGPNNRLVSDNPFIEYVPFSPQVIARRMVEVLERPDAVERSSRMSASVADISWETSGRQFLDAFEAAMRRGPQAS